MTDTVGYPSGVATMERSTTVLADAPAMTLLHDDGLRAGLYGLLARLLAEPPAARLVRLLEEIEDAGAVADELAVAWRLLRIAARDCDAAVLDDEYHALFIGIGRGELVPYASWYLTGFLMDRPLAQLRHDLAALGLERQAGGSEPEDHAATLCESMRVIVLADDIPFADQRRFFHTHLASWMPAFFRDLQSARGACLYAAVGGLGEAFLKFEGRYLEFEQ